MHDAPPHDAHAPHTPHEAPSAIVIRTAGTNCDLEMVRAFQVNGADVAHVHVDRLVEDPTLLDPCAIIGLPGGFSYGDDCGSGRVLAARMRERLWPGLRRAAERGALIIGVCNGFQVLTQLGLLPGFEENAWPDSPPAPTLALADNAGARFIDEWVGLKAEASSVCVWTRGLEDVTEVGGAAVMRMPIAHGEGRFVAESDALLDALEARGQVALRYADNVNGSQRAIAGVCDPTGRIFGLMPHPERYLEWSRHPFWTRLDTGARAGETPGNRVYRNAVETAAALGVGA